MTLQEIFDKVAVHLLTQNQKARQHGKCVYSTSEGLSCAVGCLIKPELYSKGFEGVTLNEVLLDMHHHALTLNVDVDKLPNMDFLPAKRALLLETLEKSGIHTGEVELKLLRKLQRVHDVMDVEDWREYLEKAADEFKLNTDVLESK